MARHPHRTASRGVIGLRRITCLQTIDIGRLTSDPVWLVPGGFIAVSGEGPSDSNESSKTTFEAALSLVHGDPGWRPESPQFSGHAATAVQAVERTNRLRCAGRSGLRRRSVRCCSRSAVRCQRWPVDGVGAHSTTSRPRIRGHGHPGIRLAWGGTQKQRLDDAKRAWSSLRGPKWGPRSYARELYGPGVSCLSYVSKRGGRVELRNTLLGSDVSQLTPEQIADQLIDLAGMRQLLGNEAAERVEFFRLTRHLKTKSEEVSKAAKSVAHFAAEVESLDRRLALLHQASQARDHYVATTVRQTLGALSEYRAARADAATAVQEAASRVDEITERLAGLEPTVVARELARTADELSAARAQRQPVADRLAQLDFDLKVVEQDLADARHKAAPWPGRRVEEVGADLQRAQAAAEAATAQECGRPTRTDRRRPPSCRPQRHRRASRAAAHHCRN